MREIGIKLGEKICEISFRAMPFFVIRIATNVTRTASGE